MSIHIFIQVLNSLITMIVTILFRRVQVANKKLIQEAFDSGVVKPKLGVDIESLEDKDGKVKVNFKDGSSEVYDRVIYVIGGTTPADFLKSVNLDLDSSGEPIIKDNLKSSVDGIYIAGDIAFKSGGSIAISLNHGYKIVKDIINR